MIISRFHFDTIQWGLQLFTSPTCPAIVSFEWFILLFLPSPCKRLSRSQSNMKKSDCSSPIQSLLFRLITASQNSLSSNELSQVPIITFHPYHVLRPRQTLQNLTLSLRFLCIDFHNVKYVVICITLLSKLHLFTGLNMLQDLRLSLWSRWCSVYTLLLSSPIKAPHSIMVVG